MVFNEHLAEEGPIAFAHACRLGDEGIVSKKVDSTYRSGPRAASGSRPVIPPSSAHGH